MCLLSLKKENNHMSKKQKLTSLNWEDFQALGSPENAPQFEEESTEESNSIAEFTIRIHLEKKHRGGKTASIVRGIDLNDQQLKDISKHLKKACGVGGSCKDGEIIIQGNQRQKILEELQKMGAKDIKFSGA